MDWQLVSVQKLVMTAVAFKPSTVPRASSAAPLQAMNWWLRALALARQPKVGLLERRL